MSSVYQPKRKEMAKVEVVTSTHYSNHRTQYQLIGSVQRGYSSFVTTQRNSKTGKCSFIDDTSSLTKRTKNDLVQFFMDKKNKGRSVAYLVVTKTNARGKSGQQTGQQSGQNSGKIQLKGDFNYGKKDSN